MAKNVLVDSSFFIDRLRELTQHHEEFDDVNCRVVPVEVLRGLENPNAHRRIAAYLGCMQFAPTLDHHREMGARLAWDLDRAGKPMQMTDLMIAICALTTDAAVLTLNRDFQRVPKLCVLHRLEGTGS